MASEVRSSYSPAAGTPRDRFQTVGPLARHACDVALAYAVYFPLPVENFAVGFILIGHYRSQFAFISNLNVLLAGQVIVQIKIAAIPLQSTMLLPRAGRQSVDQRVADRMKDIRLDIINIIDGLHAA